MPQRSAPAPASAAASGPEAGQQPQRAREPGARARNRGHRIPQRVGRASVCSIGAAPSPGRRRWRCRSGCMARARGRGRAAAAGPWAADRGAGPRPGQYETRRPRGRGMPRSSRRVHRNRVRAHPVLAEVAITPAVELDDPASLALGVGGQLVVMHRARAVGRQDTPAGVVEPPGRSRSRPSRRRSRDRASPRAAAASRRTSTALDCTQPTSRDRAAAALNGVGGGGRNSAADQRPARVRAGARRRPSGDHRSDEQLCACGRRARVCLECVQQCARATRLGPRSPRSGAGGIAPRASLQPHVGRSRAPFPARRSSAMRRTSRARGAHRLAEPSSEALSSTSTSWLHSGPGGRARSRRGRRAAARARSC